MIGFTDAFILARTKIKMRRIRTGLTVGVSGILFGLVITLSFLVAGIERSINSFSTEGLGARFILGVTVTHNEAMQSFEIARKPEVIERAEVLHKQRIADKKAAANKLQVAYDPAGEQAAIENRSGEKWLSPLTPAGRQAIAEYRNAQPPAVTPREVMKQKIDPFAPKQYFSAEIITQGAGSWATMKGGEEDLSNKLVPQFSDPLNDKADPILNGVMVMDQSLTESFLLKDMKWRPEQATIPVIATYGQVEQILGLSSLKSDSTPTQKLERIKYIREKSAGLRVETCYRNQASVMAIQETISQNQLLEKSKTNKDFVKPKVISELPNATTCGAPVVVSDTRSANEKKYDTNLKSFEKQFDQVTDPVQEKFTFQIVGLSPGYSMQTGGLLGDVMTAMFSPTLGTYWVVPRDLYNKLPSTAKFAQVIEPDDRIYGLSNEMYFAEFSDFNSARQVVKKYSCISGGCNQNQNVYVHPFGSSSITIAELKDGAKTAVLYSLLVVIGIAVIIMLGTTGRAIADSRRETAVFRAIGAKRVDISTIYILYTVMLAVRVVLFALILSVVIVSVIEYFQSPAATVTAQLLFNSSDLSRTFNFFGINVSEIIALCGLIILTAVVSMIIPLLRALRRSPIKDMRDEN